MATRVEGKLYESLTGQLFELGRQLRQKNGYPFDPAILQKYLQNAIEGKFPIVDAVGNTFLRLISDGETLIIDASNGTKVLAEAKDVFTYIDPDLKRWGADQQGPATEETPVEMHEMTKDGTFSQMFHSLSSDVRKLCLTQSQIIRFVKKYRNWLRTYGYGTFFLFESNDEIFVAFVRFDSDGSLKVGVRRLEYSDVWFAGLRHRLVAPLLA